MATLLTLKSIVDDRGRLTVLDKIDELLPFAVKRIFYIQQAEGAVRGGHMHVFTQHAVICLVGSCRVTIYDGKEKYEFFLNGPDQCLVIENYDWHTMHHFSDNAILLALASTEFDPTDYIYKPYANLVANDTV